MAPRQVSPPRSAFAIATRPSSAFTFSFHVLEALHLPVLMIPLPPLLWPASAAGASETSIAVSAATAMHVRFCMTLLGGMSLVDDPRLPAVGSGTQRDVGPRT